MKQKLFPHPASNIFDLRTLVALAFILSVSGVQAQQQPTAPATGAAAASPTNGATAVPKADGKAYGSYPAGFTQPDVLNFNEHEGYISLFDGTSLKGWDGRPGLWNVTDGAIVGETTPENRSGNTFLVYRDLEAKDFTLKLEIKAEGSSGAQYRSKLGTPPPGGGPAAVANATHLLIGPQADFRPNPTWVGGLYSENTGMNFVTWVGQVVEASGQGKPKKLMAYIGDPVEVAGAGYRPNEWNQITIIARGPIVIHIVNGQVMTVTVDDDPKSPNNQSGFIGIQLEPPVPNKVFVRNVWLKRIN